MQNRAKFRASHGKQFFDERCLLTIHSQLKHNCPFVIKVYHLPYRTRYRANSIGAFNNYQTLDALPKYEKLT